MTGRAGIAIGSKPRRRWLVPGMGAGLCGLIAALGLAAGPLLFEPAALEHEMSRQIRATTGLVLEAKSPARFALFPQPHLSMGALHLADPSGTLTIDADGVLGEVRLFALLAGRLEISSAALSHPKLDINLDGGPVPSDSTIGKAFNPALREIGRAPATAQDQRLGIVTLSDGTASIGRRDRPGRIAISHIDVTVDWRNLDAAATLTGAVDFEGQRTDVAAWMGLPSSLMRGDRSPIALHVQSATIGLSANGELENAPGLRFRGHVAGDAPSLGTVLALAGYATPLPAPFAGLTLSSDAVISGTGIDLQNLHFHLDGNDYEGTLAYQGNGPAPALAGTLATETWTLSPFLDHGPKALDPAGHWSAQKLDLDPQAPINLDLRISATHLRLPPLAIDDAAVAVITRDRRTEIALVAGKAYGGTIKGRASAALAGNGGLSLRATGTLANADLSALSWDVLGRQWAAGQLTASINAETSGTNAQELAANLQGWAKGLVADGELSGADIGHGLREVARNRPDSILNALRSGRTPFKTLQLGVNVSGGIATLTEARMNGADSDAVVEGKADIPARTVDLHAVTTAPESTAGPAAAAARLAFAITGSFDKLTVAPDFGAPPAR